MIFLKPAICFMSAMINSLTRACDPGWFGNGCQYKNHCTTADCGETERCQISDTDCSRGWFGPGCQYVDLLVSSENKKTFSRLTDNNNETCLTISSASEGLTIRWSQRYHMTWMRFYLSLPAARHNFINVTTGSDIETSQHHYTSVRVSKHIMDIHFTHPVLTDEIKIFTDPSENICSLYISGGRNIALRQMTSQTSTRTHKPKGVLLTSSLAVDGNTNGYMEGNGTLSCSSTSFSDKVVTWDIKFKYPKFIYHFVIHNRDVEDLYYRLMGFVLTAYGKDNSLVFDYKETGSKALAVYNITMPYRDLPVAYVRIGAATNTNNNVTVKILELCEVEIFGDSWCPTGTYGRECEQRCECVIKGEKCYVSDGACPSGCIDNNCPEKCLQASSGAASDVVLGIYVGAGVGVFILLLILGIIILLLRQRKFRKTPTHTYDVPSNTQQLYNNYSIPIGPVTSNKECTTCHNGAANDNDESQLYERINSHEYVEPE